MSRSQKFRHEPTAAGQTICGLQTSAAVGDQLKGFVEILLLFRHNLGSWTAIPGTNRWEYVAQKVGLQPTKIDKSKYSNWLHLYSCT